MTSPTNLQDAADTPAQVKPEATSEPATPAPILLPQARRQRWAQNVFRFGANSFWNVLSLLLGLATWELLGRTLELAYFPPFTAVVDRLVELTTSGRVLPDLVRSVQNLAIGFGIASAVGICVGVLMGRFRLLERMLDPYVYGLMTTPTIVFAPVYFSIFGLDRWSIIFLIIQYSVFIVIVNTVTAVHSVDRELLEMASVFGGNERQKLRKIVLPGALPLVMAGLRLGMGRSVKGMINGELLIAVVGLGATSQGFARAFDAEGVFAVLLVVVLVALAATKLVDLVDRRVNSWLPNSQR